MSTAHFNPCADGGATHATLGLESFICALLQYMRAQYIICVLFLAHIHTLYSVTSVPRVAVRCKNSAPLGVPLARVRFLVMRVRLGAPKKGGPRHV